MRILPSTLRDADPAELRLHPDNPREGDVGAIHQSIEANGFYGRILVQKSTGYVLKGNHTFQAALAAGATLIPIEEIDVDDDHARRILLADNRASDLASYNLASLAELLQRQVEESGSLEGTGFDGDDLDQLHADLTAGLEQLGADEPAAADPEETPAAEEETPEKLPRRFGIRLVGEAGDVRDVELGPGWGIELRAWEHLGATLSIERVAGELLGRVVDPRTKNVAVVLGVRDEDTLADDLEVLVGPIRRGELGA